MPIVTLTSDWNRNDWYLPRLKGRLYGYFRDLKTRRMQTVSGESVPAGSPTGSPAEGRGTVPDEDCTVVDISHSVRPFDVAGACFILRNCYRDFPEGTIHLLAVECEPSPGKPMVIVPADGQYVVGIDDGRFSLLFDPLPDRAYRLPAPGTFSTFMAAEQFADAVGVIVENAFEYRTEPCVPAGSGAERPAIMSDRILGRVIYIDSYGNAVTNIPREAFSRLYAGRAAACGREPALEICVQGPYLKLHSVCRRYSDVACGSDVAVFNSLGLLELAVNGGNFAQVENIDTTAEVTVRFG